MDFEDEMDYENDRLLRLPEVAHLTGLSKSTIYKMVDEGRFPKQVRNGSRAVAWPRRVVAAWIKERPSVKKKDS